FVTSAALKVSNSSSPIFCPVPSTLPHGCGMGGAAGAGNASGVKDRRLSRADRDKARSWPDPLIAFPICSATVLPSVLLMAETRFGAGAACAACCRCVGVGGWLLQLLCCAQ